MTVGFIGLGKMGQNIVTHLSEQGVNVVVYNRTREITDKFKSQIPNPNDQQGIITFTYAVDELVKNLSQPRVFFLMVKAGKPVDEVISQLTTCDKINHVDENVAGEKPSGICLETGDTIIDGGNSFYQDSIRRYKQLKEKGITFIDCGTSGGLEGARNGACLMLGGEWEAVEKLHELWDALASQGSSLRSWVYVGPTGAGHFVKMVHNGIEYGIDQALGEGMEVLEKAPYKLNLAEIAKVWSHGSVIRGWLVELIARALEKDPHLESFTGKVAGGETGEWMKQTAKELGVDVKILEQTIETRQKSHSAPAFTTKVISALRKEYGGHEEFQNKP